MSGSLSNLEHPSPPGIDKFLQRLFLSSGIVLLLASSYTMYRVSRVVAQIEASVEVVAAKVDQLNEKISSLEKRTREALKSEIVQEGKDLLRQKGHALLEKWAPQAQPAESSEPSAAD